MCFANMKKWAEKKLKKMDLYDIKLIKITVFAFALMIAKLWPKIIALDWYWYLVIVVIAAIRPYSKILRK